ncbi:AMP-binding protein [Frankia tisae]|uniref:AMP-binding protein n=1 Tax=Frankia tisae TaxID=2950104 RepID=UPI0021BFE922|nr:AMP-binding protein [Frankia tisae]
MTYLTEKIERAAKQSGSVTFLDGTDVQRVEWSKLYDDALRLSAALQGIGAGSGHPLGILAPTSRPAVVAALAGWLAGASVTFLPSPARATTPAGYLAATRARLDSLGEPVVLVGDPWTDSIDGLANPGRVVTDLPGVLSTALAGPEPITMVPAGSDDDPAVLQLTSGTTGAAKIVQISHANLAANIDAIKQATGHESIHGRMLSWLPLSHDMGLVGSLLVPLTCGRCDTILSSPADFLARPAEWMRRVDRHRATTTVGPNAAYALAARLLATGPTLDLSSLRCALSGGEPIDPEVVDAFTAAGRRHGLDPAGFVPAYGMAEATVAVAISPVGRGLRCDVVGAEDLERHGIAVPMPAGASPGAPARPGISVSSEGETPPAGRVRRIPLLGKPVQGLEARIVDQTTGRPMPERQVGEIQVRGTSVTAGYRGDAETTSARFLPEGWLRTGDLGYQAGGELAVTGRIKDVVILAGRNIYPDEVERAAARVPGVRPGNAVAFGFARRGPLGDGEGLAIAVESRTDDPERVRTLVLDEVRAALGIMPHAVIVLSPGSIPKTPSGKLQRAEAARRFTPR